MAIRCWVSVYCMIYWRNTFRLIERDDHPAVDKVLLIPERSVIFDKLFHCQLIYMSNKSITSSLKFEVEWVCMGMGELYFQISKQ